MGGRLFSAWLHVTAKLQREKYGRDLGQIEDRDAYGEELRQHVTGAIEELGEYLKDADWKPWKPRPQFASEEMRTRRQEELVDVLHFIANLCVLEGLDDDLLSELYLAKVDANRARPDHTTYPVGQNRDVQVRDDGHDPMIPSGAYM